MKSGTQYIFENLHIVNQSVKDVFVHGFEIVEAPDGMQMLKIVVYLDPKLRHKIEFSNP